MQKVLLLLILALALQTPSPAAASKRDVQFQRAVSILARMILVWDSNPILRAAERSGPITALHLLPTAEVHLMIDLNRGTIYLSDGFLEEIQKVGPNWEHALAAAFGHELAHRVFASSSWCTHSGLRDMPFYLRCLSKSRDEERRADILGARLACQAGANLNRIVVFWEHMDRQRVWQHSWFRHHPPAGERAARLHREFAECAARQATGRHREPLTSLDVMNVRW